MKPIIAIVGPGKCSQMEADLAEAVGAMIAKLEAIVVCGGGSGVMEAACKGAATAGGITVGILPGIEVSAGNPYLTIALPTGLGEARNALVATAGQAMIAIGGSYGTLSEIALALKAGRKVIGLETWSASDHAERQIQLLAAKDAADAVEMAFSEIDDA